MRQLKIGFQTEQGARQYLYEIWRTMDIDVRNPVPPSDIVKGDTERWQIGAHFLYWSFGTAANDIHMQAAGLKQYPAFIVFDQNRSDVNDNIYRELTRVARGFAGEIVR